jgi:hypothetical protein
VEGASDEYPKFWGALIDDAVRTREPVSELRPGLDGIWNEFAFPLMCGDPTGLPSSLVVGYVEDQSFDDARLLEFSVFLEIWTFSWTCLFVLWSYFSHFSP